MTSILKGPHQNHWACFQTNAIGWAKPKQEMIPLVLLCCHRQADVTLYKFKDFGGRGMSEPSSQTRVTTLNLKPNYRAALSSGELAPNIFQKQEQIQCLWLAEKTPKSTFTWSHSWRHIPTPYMHTQKSDTLRSNWAHSQLTLKSEIFFLMIGKQVLIWSARKWEWAKNKNCSWSQPAALQNFPVVTVVTSVQE